MKYAFALAMLVCPSMAFAQDLQSTFTSGDQNWKFEAAVTETPVWMQSGGYNGAYIMNECNTIDDQGFWIAPAKYRGDQQAFLDGTLKVWRNNSRISQPLQVRLDITGANGDMVSAMDYQGFADGTTGWYRFAFTLKAGRMFRLNDQYNPPTRADLRAVLADVAEVRIQAYGCDGIDSVHLTRPPVP